MSDKMIIWKIFCVCATIANEMMPPGVDNELGRRGPKPVTNVITDDNEVLDGLIHKHTMLYILY